MGTIVPDFRAERDHRRMLEEQELIGNPVGLARRDQLLLERETLGIWDDAEPADMEGNSHLLGRGQGDSPPYSSNFSSRSLTNERNRPASAPSISR